MKRLQLSEWAAIGELVGTAAVIISLLFLAYSVEQNTEAVRGATENLLFERHGALQNNFIADATLADIYARMQAGDKQLSAVEDVRWRTYQSNMLDIWEIAYMRNAGGLLGDREWRNWNSYFSHMFAHGAEKLSESEWRNLAYAYDAGFWSHVGNALGFAGQN